MLPLLVACSDYGLEKPVDHPREAEAGDVPTDSDFDPPDSGDSSPPDDSAPPEDSAPPGDTGCVDGYYADYYNLPSDHPDMEQEIVGVVTGDSPANHDWWSEAYFAFRVNDPGLEFGSGWWPVNEGLPGDPQYFAVHWTASLEVTTAGTHTFELGSDDDSWAYIDGAMVADLGGIHGVAATQFSLYLDAGVHPLDLYMAERHTYDSGFWFKWLSEGVRIYACP